MAAMIRNLAATAIATPADRQPRVYMTVTAFLSEQFKSLLDHFSNSQFVAEMDTSRSRKCSNNGLIGLNHVTYFTSSPHFSWRDGFASLPLLERS